MKTNFLFADFTLFVRFLRVEKLLFFKKNEYPTLRYSAAFSEGMFSIRPAAKRCRTDMLPIGRLTKHGQSKKKLPAVRSVKKSLTPLNYGFILLLSALTGCFNPVIPIVTQPKYPIDIIYAPNTPDRPYTELQVLFAEKESPLDARQLRNKGRLLYRGNDMNGKDLITARLVIEAQKLGADALINVKYKVYSTERSSGYSLEALAVKYE